MNVQNKLRLLPSKIICIFNPVLQEYPFLIQVLCLFFNWIVCLPGVESCEFCIYFGDQTFVQGITGKYIFPYSWFSFHFNDVLFSHAEAFYFDEIPFVYSSLCPCSRGHTTFVLLLKLHILTPPFTTTK